MQNIHYITAEDILSVIEKLTYDDIVITDNYTVKEIAQKYNNQCKQVYYYSRKSLHQQIEHFKCGANVRLGVAVLDAGKRSGREAAEHRAALRSTTAPHPARGRYWLVLPSTSVFCVITPQPLAITAFLSTHASQNSCVRVLYSVRISIPIFYNIS